MMTKQVDGCDSFEHTIFLARIFLQNQRLKARQDMMQYRLQTEMQARLHIERAIYQTKLHLQESTQNARLALKRSFARLREEYHRKRDSYEGVSFKHHMDLRENDGDGITSDVKTEESYNPTYDLEEKNVNKDLIKNVLSRKMRTIHYENEQAEMCTAKNGTIEEDIESLAKSVATDTTWSVADKLSGVIPSYLLRTKLLASDDTDWDTETLSGIASNECSNKEGQVSRLPRGYILQQNWDSRQSSSIDTPRGLSLPEVKNQNNGSKNNQLGDDIEKQDLVLEYLKNVEKSEDYIKQLFDSNEDHINYEQLLFKQPFTDSTGNESLKEYTDNYTKESDILRYISIRGKQLYSQVLKDTAETESASDVVNNSDNNEKYNAGIGAKVDITTDSGSETDIENYSLTSNNDADKEASLDYPNEHGREEAGLIGKKVFTANATVSFVSSSDSEALFTFDNSDVFLKYDRYQIPGACSPRRMRRYSKRKNRHRKIQSLGKSKGDRLDHTIEHIKDRTVLNRKKVFTPNAGVSFVSSSDSDALFTLNYDRAHTPGTYSPTGTSRYSKRRSRRRRMPSREQFERLAPQEHYAKPRPSPTIKSQDYEDMCLVTPLATPCINLTSPMWDSLQSQEHEQNNLQGSRGRFSFHEDKIVEIDEEQVSYTSGEDNLFLNNEEHENEVHNSSVTSDKGADFSLNNDKRENEKHDNTNKTPHLKASSRPNKSSKIPVWTNKTTINWAVS